MKTAAKWIVAAVTAFVLVGMAQAQTCRNARR